MSMNTVFNLNGEGGRTFAIDVQGNPHQAALRSSAYTLKVPYSSLAQTIHSIGQRGGKVVDVKLLTAQLSDLGITPVAAGALKNSFEEQVTPKPPAKQTRTPEPEPRRQQSKSKKR